MLRLSIAALVGATVALLAVSLALRGYDLEPKNTEPSYALILTLSDGNEYALEYNVTKEDCHRRLVELFGEENLKGVECKAEGQ